MPELDEEATATRRATGQVHLVRAGVVVGCFLVALLLLLGPASNGSFAAHLPPTTPAHHFPPVNKAATTVQVANGTTKQHAAEAMTQSLKLKNWNALPPVQATVSAPPVATLIYFAPGLQHAGDVLANDLGLKWWRVKPRTANLGVPGAAGDDLVIIIGTDYAH